MQRAPPPARPRGGGGPRAGGAPPPPPPPGAGGGPRCRAYCSGVSPRRSAAFGRAPFESSRRTIAASPQEAASCSGVTLIPRKPVLRAFTDTPRSRSSFTVSGSPPAAA